MLASLGAHCIGYFDITAFVNTPAGANRFGNAGPGILIGPRTVAVAAGMSKTFPIKERLRMRMEATFTNLPNHPNGGNSGNRNGESGLLRHLCKTDHSPTATPMEPKPIPSVQPRIA